MPQKSTVRLKVPIALGGKDTVEGYVKDEGAAGIRVGERPDFKGRVQFFPAHLVEKVEPLAEDTDANPEA